MGLNLQNLFVSVVNMSITGTYVILFVLLIRFPLKKAPKIFSYSLWGAVLFRLVCPYSFSTAFSLLKSISFSGSKTEVIPIDIGLMGHPSVDVGINRVNNVINSVLPAATPYASINPMQFILSIFSIVWIIGVLIMTVYSITSYILLKKKIQSATLVYDNVFECESIQTPFVLGIIKPKIYMSSGLSSNEKAFILKHEQTHIKRLDYLVKPFAFLVLCLHWFNPFVWMSFIMMSRDMEMSCDESVIKELGNGIKREYSTSLLAMALNTRLISGSPLAFSESDVKRRIKNVLNYKKPSLWVVFAFVIIVVVIGIGLISNPKIEKSDLESRSETYLNNRTEYIGNASKVGGIISLLNFPADVTYDHIELQTGTEPYGVTIYLKNVIGTLDDAMVSDYTNYQKNALILFSLIRNADEVIFNLSDGNKSNTMQFSRVWANGMVNGEIWGSSENQSFFEEFLRKLDSGAFDLIEESKQGKNPFEENLKIIMSSPQNLKRENLSVSGLHTMIKEQGIRQPIDEKNSSS